MPLIVEGHFNFQKHALSSAFANSFGLESLAGVRFLGRDEVV